MLIIQLSLIEAELSSSSFQRKCIPSSHRRHGNRVGVVARLRPIAEKFLRKFCTTFYLRGLERLRGDPYVGNSNSLNSMGSKRDSSRVADIL